MFVSGTIGSGRGNGRPGVPGLSLSRLKSAMGFNSPLNSARAATKKTG